MLAAYAGHAEPVRGLIQRRADRNRPKELGPARARIIWVELDTRNGYVARLEDENPDHRWEERAAARKGEQAVKEHDDQEKISRDARSLPSRLPNRSPPPFQRSAVLFKVTGPAVA